MMRSALLTRVTTIAVRHTVPDCWPCTLLRISLALRWRIALAAFLAGVGFGLVAGAAVALALMKVSR